MKNKKIMYVMIFCLTLGLTLGFYGLAQACSDCGCCSGCTPGYWKQPHHEDSWDATPYDPEDCFEEVFNVDLGANENGCLTLLDALNARGGGINALLRHAVAALLNAAHPDIRFAWCDCYVLYIVRDALVNSMGIESLKDELDELNNMGCPLN